jgi:hypothetical protein
MFQTTDGRTFPSQAEADAHQLGLNRRKAIRDAVKPLLPANRPGASDNLDNLVGFLYLHIEKVQDLIDRMRAAELLNHHERGEDR